MMTTKGARRCGAVLAAALLLGLAPAALAQQGLQETHVRSSGDRIQRNAVDASGEQQVESPTGLRAGPARTPEGGRAGAEVGPSDQYGFNDSRLNDRARLAYPE